jgi:hypothetical protein
MPSEWSWSGIGDREAIENWKLEIEKPHLFARFTIVVKIAMSSVASLPSLVIEPRSFATARWRSLSQYRASRASFNAIEHFRYKIGPALGSIRFLKERSNGSTRS